MYQFLDPRNDYAFKRIFGNEKKPNVLRSFLNGTLNLSGEHTIDKVTILNPYQAPHIKDAKETILDVRCDDQGGQEYIVEMQVLPQTAFDQRVLYYASKSYALQLEGGEDYDKLRKIIFLGVLGFNFGEGNHFLSTHHILDIETKQRLIRDFEFVFVQLPKFNKAENELQCMMDKWTYFLKHAHKLEQVPPILQMEPEIAEAFEIANRCNWTKEELIAYENRTTIRRDEMGRIQYGYEKGEKVGLKKGEKIGIEKNKIDIAKNLLAQGLDLSIIAQATMLSTEILMQLIADDKKRSQLKRQSKKSTMVHEF